MVEAKRKEEKAEFAPSHVAATLEHELLFKLFVCMTVSFCINNISTTTNYYVIYRQIIVSWSQTNKLCVWQYAYKINLQSLWRLAQYCGSTNHLPCPHIPHEPADMANCAAHQITCRRSPCSIQQPRECNKGQREVGRCYGEKAK